MSLNRRRKVLFALVAVFLSIIFAVVVVEIVMRLLGGYDVDDNWRYHPVVGWTQVPGAQYDMTMNGLDFPIAFNRDGFRDNPFSKAKAPGIRRIAILGDSFSESTQVPLENTFHHLVEQRLGAGWEVFNFGVGDHGTAQELLIYQQLVRQFEPDLIIHQIFPLNDICNNNVQMAGLCKSRNDRYRPYIDQTGQVVSSQQGLKWLRDLSVLWFIAERRWLQQQPEPDWEQRSAVAGFESDPLIQTYLPPTDSDPRVESGWQTTEQLITRIIAETRADGVEYIGLVIPFEPRVGEGWGSFSRANPKLVRDYPEQRLQRLFDAEEVEYVMALEDFERNIERVLPYWGGHLSPAGHEVVADALLVKVHETDLFQSGATR